MHANKVTLYGTIRHNPFENSHQTDEMQIPDVALCSRLYAPENKRTNAYTLHANINIFIT